MKKILLLFFAIFSVNAYSQYVETVAEFDFTKPDELTSNPPISFMSGTLDYMLTDKVLTANEGDVVMSFTDSGNGVIFNYTENGSEITYYMQIRNRAEMQIKLANKGYELVKVEFTGYIGALGNVNSVDKTWRANDSHVSSVLFKNGTTETRITKVLVTYKKKAEPLELKSPKSGSSISGSSFKSIQLVFNQNVSLDASKKVILYPVDSYNQRDEANSSEMTVTIQSSNPSKVILGSTSEMSNGKYEVFIPSGTFLSSQGATTGDISFFYSYRGKLETPLISPNPADVTFFRIPSEVILTFDRPVQLKEEPYELSNGLSNESNSYATTLSQEGLSSEEQVRLTLTDNLKDEEAMFQGDWQYQIPEGIIVSKANAQLDNANIAITYQIENTSDLLDETKTLYARSRNGSTAAVGYPNLETAGRNALINVLNTYKPSYSQIKTAINAFCQEQDIMLPVSDKWYQIAGVCKGDTSYLRCHNDVVTLTKDKTSASSFRAVKQDGKFDFLTVEGKYLHLNATKEESGTNIATDKNAQGFVLQKFNYPNDSIAGLLSMQALESLFAIAEFGDSLSRGFMFKESSEAANKVRPQIKLSKSLIDEAGDELILTVENVDKVTLVERWNSYFRKDGAKINVYNPILIETGETGREFLVKTQELTAAGEYELVIPAGVFTYYKEGFTSDEFEVAEMTTTFKIGKGSSSQEDPTLPNYNFNYSKFNVLQYFTKDIDYMVSTDLNDIVIFAYMDDYTDLIPDTTVKVSIVKYYGETIIASGHFTVYEKFSEDYGMENTKAIMLKLDKPFEKGDLKYNRGLYKLIVPAATFGDANFGKYIDKNIPGNEKPNPEECRVNALYNSFTFYVDDTRADKEYPSNEVLTLASNLEKIEGVGYPTKDCTARKKLENLVDTRVGSDETFMTAINNFYSTSYVTMPSDDGTYYKVIAVSDSTEAYLAYDGEKGFLTADPEMATGFLTKNIGDGTFMFVTGDGKYLRQLSSEPNVSQDVSAVNNITLAKFAVVGVEPVKTFGLFSIQAEGGYALADVKDLKMLAASEGLTNFDNVKTNGFKLEAITDNSKIAPPTVKATLDPAHGEYIEALTKVKVTFSGVLKVDLADKTRITLSSATQDNVGKLSIDPVEGKTDEYVITISDLPESPSYTLWIERGAFSYVFAGTTREVNSVRANFNIGTSGISGITVDASDKPVYDLQGRKVSGVLKSGIYIKNGKKIYIK